MELGDDQGEGLGGVGAGIAVEEGHEDLADVGDAMFGAGADDVLRAAEVAVDGAGGHAGRGDDVVHRGDVEAVAREAAERAGEDVLAAVSAGGVAEGDGREGHRHRRSCKYTRRGLWMV
jgi:hypothetical protein